MHSIPNIPDTIAREIYAELCRSLPPPPDHSSESQAIRDEHAMTAVAHLLPENVAEANVAVQIVAAQFQARDALRTASHLIPLLDPGRIPGADPGTTTDPDEIRRCRAWAASMMRQADSGIRTLLRMQAERQKAEDALRPAAMQRAGYWFRSASVPDPGESRGLAPGSPQEPVDPPNSPASPQEPAETLPLPPESPGLTRGEDPGLTRGPSSTKYGALTPAERYVTLYPDRAAYILAAGGLPAHLAFPPPDAAVITDLLSSHSPLICTLRRCAPDLWPATGPDPVAA